VVKKFKIFVLFILTMYSLNYTAISREERIIERIKPMNSIHLTEGAELASSAKPTLGKDAGIKRYKASCYICHDTGASGAPRIGDKSTWGTRIKAGKDSLYKHAIEGINAMPAKGGCLNCSDEEIKMTVDYMLQKTQ
jgi:cytochrome c5